MSRTLTFQSSKNKGLEYNMYRLLEVREKRVIQHPKYEPIYDGGLELRGAVPAQDPWIGITRPGDFVLDQYNLERMLNGNPPWARDNHRMVLHHRANQPNGPLDAYQDTFHGGRAFKALHDPEASILDFANDYSSRAQYDEQVWSKQRARYWVTRALCHLEQRPFR